MLKTYSLQTFAIAGAMSAMFLSSCALPPREAWQRIQDDGLITYLSGAWKDNPSSQPVNATPASDNPASRPAPNPVLVSTGSPKENKPVPSFTANDEPLKILSAQSVPSLPGFVRSPYTNPPRLVDVKGTSPGTTMICPYTQRPFLVPADFQNPQTANIASAPSVKTQPKVVSSNAKPQEPIGIVTPQTPATLAFNKAPAPKTSAAPANNTPESAPKTAAAQDLPTGTLIPGRPGFVNSPFAAKHQLVDVTGLPAGMEVKCPYTGKLFRVPAQDMVSSKAEDPSKILSSPAPEKKEKK